MQRGVGGIVPSMILSMSRAGSYQYCQNIRYGTWYAAWTRRHRSDDDPQHVANRLVPVLPEHPLRHVACSAGRRHRPVDDPQQVANRFVPVLPEHPLQVVVCSVESAPSAGRAEEPPAARGERSSSRGQSSPGRSSSRSSSRCGTDTTSGHGRRWRGLQESVSADGLRDFVKKFSMVGRNILEVGLMLKHAVHSGSMPISSVAQHLLCTTVGEVLQGAHADAFLCLSNPLPLKKGGSFRH